MPMGEVMARLDEIPVDREVVVVCQGPATARHRSTAYLTRSAGTAVNLDGGMYAWARAGRPMVSETGAPPAVV